MNNAPKSSPRQRILEVVDHLFYTEGVRATGTEKIMAMAEVAKATFYHHFESKDALVLAYLEKRDCALWDFLSQPTSLREVLVKFEEWANRPDVIGCPFLRIASEYPDPAHPFHQFAIEHQNKILACLASLLDASVSDKKAAAGALLSVIDGALTLRMLYGRSKEIRLVSLAEGVLKTFS
jgi:AcrR family transcriptional regulator